MFQNGIEELPGLFRIAVGQEFLGQAAPLAQEGDHLIHACHKVHLVSFLPWLCLHALERPHHSIGDKQGAEGIVCKGPGPGISQCARPAL